MYFYMKNSHFLFKVISKYTPKRINRKTFRNISSQELPHSRRVSKIFTSYIKNGNLFNFHIKMIIFELFDIKNSN